MSRYPFTEAYDAIRMACRDPYGPVVQQMPSRSQAAQILDLIADAISHDRTKLAERIADFSKQSAVIAQEGMGNG